MFKRCLNSPGLAYLLALGLIGTLSAPRAARAQWVTDPYRPFYSNYQPYAYPDVPDTPLWPNAVRMGAARMNQFESLFREDFLDGYPTGLDGPFDNMYRTRTSPPSSNRHDRNYRQRDDGFYRGLREQDNAYFEAMRERDPRRRAEMLREYRENSRLSDRELSPSRTQRSSRSPYSSSARTGGSSTTNRARLREGADRAAGPRAPGASSPPREPADRIPAAGPRLIP